ncbi:DUF4139 domain-containing protein [Pendulispora brunnea]|uniref:DUF4139 domain-containing protein n=1 Tax=Pendulispora brunnea TaxID=2905690 RepID=A0ABZ2KM50_9BACT
MQEIACESRIASVDLFARGAVVTRLVTLPSDLPDDEVDLRVGGITAQAQSGSVRAALSPGSLDERAERRIVYVRARAVLPVDSPAPGELAQRVRDLERDLEKLELEQRYVHARRAAVGTVKPEPMLDVRWRRIDPESRVSDALAVLSLVDDLTLELDRRLLAIDDARVDLEKRLERARLEAAQGGTAERSQVRETRAIVVRLGAGPRPSALEVSYAVPSARWWPVYSARFTTGPKLAAEWSLEAFVAQATGEDWSGVHVSLSTVGLVRDAQLPELLSYRLGRKQPPPRRGFRPVPEGLREMFAGYDEAIARFVPPPAPALRAARAVPRHAGPHAALDEAVFSMAESAVAAEMPEMPEVAEAADMNGVEELAFAPAPAPVPAPMPVPAAYGAAAAPMAMPRRQAKALVPARAMVRAVSIEDQPTVVGYPDSYELQPTDAWLDFDALVLADMDDRDKRGQLVRDPSEMSDAASDDTLTIERIPMPRYASDPRYVGNGERQVRYRAETPVDIGSDGVPHRILVRTAAGEAALSLIALPRESAEVYREAAQRNPFEGATLLPGPADVFLDGGLLTTSALELTGDGGSLRLGLGVEERIRVVRNVRAQEEAAGFLGGKIAVVHEVSIELSSALGYPVTLKVYDRLPVTEDKDVEIELISSRPRPDKYDQAERGAPIRGGLVWQIELGAAGRGRIDFSYRIVLPAKSELEGGNRRE